MTFNDVSVQINLVSISRRTTERRGVRQPVRRVEEDRPRDGHRRHQTSSIPTSQHDRFPGLHPPHSSNV